MITKYKKISIIYGGSGREYAAGLNKYINERRSKERYPFASNIIFEVIMSGDLSNDLYKLVHETDYAVVFLTLDDKVNKKLRIRQNVLLEIGMMLAHLPKEKIIFIADYEKKLKKAELPSDMQNTAITYVDPKKMDEAYKNIFDKIIKIDADFSKKNVVTYDHLFLKPYYYVDYRNLFKNCKENSTLVATTGYELESILQSFLNECRSLKTFDEKAIYLLERIALLPVFGKQKAANNFYKQARAALGEIEHNLADEIKDYENGDELYRIVRETIYNVLDYISLGLIEDNKPKASDYKAILSNLKSLKVDHYKDLNPLVLTIYYDYIGLIYMMLFNFTDKKDIDLLNKSIEYYELVYDTYVPKIENDIHVWSGFMTFNIARAYGMRYEITGNKEDLEKSLDMFELAERFRKEWLDIEYSSSIFKSALSYEYFIARVHHLNFLTKNNLETEKDRDKLRKEIENDLETYSNQEMKVERLIYIKHLLSEFEELRV